MHSSKQIRRIEISLSQQSLHLFADQECIMTAPVSTAKNGPGERKDSEQTPRGAHYVRAKIGAGLPVNAILRGRRFTQKIYSQALARQFPERDWILTRILWLCGLEVGKNRLGHVDSMQRYIYIHGTPDSEPMGLPRSHGCIRMRNDDVVRLFDATPQGCQVDILD